MSQAKRRKVDADGGPAGQDGGVPAAVGPNLEACVQVLTARMKAVQNGKASGKAGDLQGKVREALLAFADLKRLVRTGFENAHVMTQRIEATREEVDKLDLQLQNQNYEKTHVLKEIRRCHQFRSRHEAFEMLSKEEFLKLPQYASEAAELEQDEHKLMLARLDYEGKERKRLAAQLEELKARKEAQSKANGTKREQLAKLPSHLKAILKAASPLQDVLGRAEENLLPTGSKARFLPKPLYIVFSHITAYCTMSSGDYAVNVVGDVALAKDLFTQGSLKTLDVNLDEVEQDDDDADDEEEAKRSTGDTDEEALAANQAKLMEAFPLNIEVVITTEEGQKVTLQFYYLHNLEVITVKSSEEKTHDNILSCLYPSDDGLELPHDPVK